MLELCGITKRWRDLLVLDNVDLTLEAGRVTRLTGDNGAGKTTLLRIATGLILPDKGSVSIAGLCPDHTGDRVTYYRRLGFLSAGDRGLYARLSVRQNLEFAAGIAFLRGRQLQGQVAAAMERFSLESLGERRVDRMSMGQRQRVRLAMTFLHEPDVVLLDEPRTSLDEDGLRMLESALEGLLARGGAALWCAPSGAGTADLRADDEYVLRDGKLLR